ncbi:YoaK family protein [Rhodococcus sovatensis]|uniref:YoaK family protein n=1 Tax=Rhodococcus sovatensis TaxID=1805840 RepID=A0ABZ2PRR0_9NOCA
MSTSATDFDEPTRPPAIWVPVVLLSFGAGAADAFAFLLLGGIFTANMTGNLVLIGLIEREHYLRVLVGAGTALVVFVGSASIALWFTRATTATVQRRSLTLLAVGAAAQIAIVVVWSMAHRDAGGSMVVGLIGLSALAMAAQTVVARRTKASGALTTTFVTGTIVSLLDDVGRGHRGGAMTRFASVAALVFGAVAVSIVSSSVPVAAPIIPASAGFAAYVVSLNNCLRFGVGKPRG